MILNISTYIFGTMGNGFSQYPSDSLASVFKNFIDYAKAPTQVIVYRNSSLIYYGYIRKIKDNKTVGLAVGLNNVMLNQQGIQMLFDMFESTFEYMAYEGMFIKYNNVGELVSCTSKRLHFYNEEISQITQRLKGGFNTLAQSNHQALPPVNYGVNRDTVKQFTITDNGNTILQSTYTNGYTLIYKSDRFNTANMNSFSGQLAKMNQKNKDLNQQNNELSRKIAALKRKQRNTTWVGLLSILVFIMGIVLYFTVINPREVTNKDMGDYTYYGPMENSLPNCEYNELGIAVFKPYDNYGRKCYVGSFKDGKFTGENVVLIYNNGDVFYGDVIGDINNGGRFNGTYFSIDADAGYQGWLVKNSAGSLVPAEE